MKSMKSLFSSLALAAALGSLLTSIQPVLAQGSLTPPGAPGPTMKSLAQIEPRTPISSAPITLTNSGSYYLTTNLTVSGGTAAINILADGVTLDLNGFTLTSTQVGATVDGILLNGPGVVARHDITICNGHIVGGVTNDSSGVFSGPGFGSGITYFGYAPINVRVTGVSVSGCMEDGIYLYEGGATIVESCTVQTVGSSGIYADNVSHSSASNCGSQGIGSDSVSDCVGICIGSGGTGISANMAINCYGQCTGAGGYGMYVLYTAVNCTGLGTTSGYGLYTALANCCYGAAGSSAGIIAYAASSCYSGTSEIITYKYNMP